MPASHQEIFDSDDDGDGLSPLSDLRASPQQLLPPSLRDSPQLDLVELPEQSAPSQQQTLLHSMAPAASTSTDLSFFRDIYEEQQGTAGKLLHTKSNEYGNQSTASGNRDDPWEVPSSPLEVTGQQRGSYLKRKRIEEHKLQRTKRLAVTVQLDDTSSGGNSEPATNQQRVTDGQSMRYQGTNLERFAPQDPLTPNRTHQYPQLLGSSIDNSFVLPYDESLPQTENGSAHQGTHYEVVPVDTVTQSTIAFTTPSIYASSGRRAVESSDHNFNWRQLESSGHADSLQENKRLAAKSTTTPRRSRKTVESMQLMSSPDIIAGPASMQVRQPQSPVIQGHGEDGAEVNEEVVGKKVQPSRRIKVAKIADQLIHAQSQYRHSVEDELSFDIGISIPEKTALETISITSHDSIPAKAAPKANVKQKRKKAVTIAASEDEGSDSGSIKDEPISLVPADSESDYSDNKVKAQAKPGAKKRLKRGQKAKEPTAKQGVAGVKAQQVDTNGNSRSLDSTELAGVQADAKAASKNDVKSVRTKAKSKRVKGASKKGQNTALATSTAEAVSTKANTDDIALRTTSGNAMLSAPIEGDAIGEKNCEAIAKKTDEKPQMHQPVTSDGKASPGPPSGPPSGLLSTGLNTAGLGRVPYRVGLSKRFRIAPLLKVIRK
ncbi:hypothetical protein SEPCBS57363_004578 [Sporothrix epigloea]|uniref:Uncharacterized protein n=1 Tax=Sporothrix epigloea TaxID=1892477 RepID=A0ABP0DUY8_9PEZI